MTDETLSLPEIPDLSGIQDPQQFTPFSDGWYEGTILAKRELTDRMGNERIFESTDQPSQAGDSRNLRLQVELVRKSDGRKYSTNTQINYRPEDFSAETVAAVTTQIEAVKGGAEWGPLFRSFMALKQLSTLQKIAGVRQLQRNGNGGLELTPLYGKKAYFRLVPDERNPEYKAIKNFQETAPKKVL